MSSMNSTPPRNFICGATIPVIYNNQSLCIPRNSYVGYLQYTNALIRNNFIDIIRKSCYMTFKNIICQAMDPLSSV